MLFVRIAREPPNSHLLFIFVLLFVRCNLCVSHTFTHWNTVDRDQNLDIGLSRASGVRCTAPEFLRRPWRNAAALARYAGSTVGQKNIKTDV